MIRLNIDVTKIDKSFLHKGAKGTYMDITLMDNRDGTDSYGNDGFAVQDVGKEKREAGIKGPIIGNWKNIVTNRPVQKSLPPAPGPSPADDFDDDSTIPF
jgi:hypothetical protein